MNINLLRLKIYASLAFLQRPFKLWSYHKIVRMVYVLVLPGLTIIPTDEIFYNKTLYSLKSFCIIIHRALAGQHCCQAAL